LDGVISADTGGESAASYATLRYFQTLCNRQSIPFTIVRNKKEYLHEFMERLGVLPVLPGSRKKLCSVKFKTEPIHEFVNKAFPHDDVMFYIGIEKNETSRVTRFVKPESDRFTYSYPLRDWGYDRSRCEQYLADHNLKISKSACYYCPHASLEEIFVAVTDDEIYPKLHAIESRFAKTSRLKHQAWIAAGRPTKSDGTCFPGHWRVDAYLAGNRLFARSMNGKRLSIEEWRQYAFDHMHDSLTGTLKAS